MDNQQAWLLQPDGTYERAQAGRKQPLRSQSALLDLHAESFSPRKVAERAERTTKEKRKGKRKRKQDGDRRRA
jgi:hypothetical protein